MATAALLFPGCDRDEPEQPHPAPAVEVGDRPVAAAAPEQLDLLQLLPTCEVRHRGLAIDVGSEAAESQRSYSQMMAEDVIPVDRSGGGFAEVRSRRLDYEFWLSEPLDRLGVSLRVHGLRSGRLAVYLDNRRIGGVRLTRGQTEIVSVRTSKADLLPGPHTLMLSFSKGSGDGEGGYIEIDWIRLSSELGLPEQYAAPTLQDIVTDVVLQKRPRRAIALHAQSSVRCPLVPAKDARLKVWLGFWGAGKGRAEVNLLRPGRQPLKLDEWELLGGSGSQWVAADLPLERAQGELVWLEFKALEATAAGRVAFGDPGLRRQQAPEPTLAAQTAVVVLLAGTARSLLPPWAEPDRMPQLAQFVRQAVQFNEYRVPSTVPAAVLASLLSGYPPRSHAVEDPAARLPHAVRTLATALKQASGHGAMFTGVPSSFPAFGFERDWDTYEALSPVKDIAAHAPFERARDWLAASVGEAQEAKRLVLIHARGAHPPWDITAEHAARLKPSDYAGPLDPRRGGITLSKIRSRTRAAQRRIADADWTRLEALQAEALEKQDAAFGKLIDKLRELGLWDDALVVVAGDIGEVRRPQLPYDPEGPLSEDHLYAPLLVKFPKQRLAAHAASQSVTTVDVAHTLFRAFGLEPPPGSEGQDLLHLAQGIENLRGRPLWATASKQYATRVGSYLLSGQLGKVPRLCEMAVDPACVHDAYAERPLVASALWKWTYFLEYQARRGERRVADREPASIDSETAAALTVWGAN